MSLLSLLFALAVERSMPAKFWQFSFYFRRYITLAKSTQLLKTPLDNLAAALAFILLPSLALLLITHVISHFLLLLLACFILLVCVGCHFTRNIYKAYLQAAFRGELTTCDLHYQQLLQDKNLSDIDIGSALIWLNFRYYIMVMLLFVTLGLPAVVFYRLLVEVVNYKASEQEEVDTETQHTLSQLLFFIEWPFVRFTAFCYILVGNFSNALGTWLESCFNTSKPHYEVLSGVAKQAEDFQLDEDDCTAEPCLMVRLAKRSLLLILAIIAVLTITGAIR